MVKSYGWPHQFIYRLFSEEKLPWLQKTKTAYSQNSIPSNSIYVYYTKCPEKSLIWKSL